MADKLSLGLTPMRVFVVPGWVQRSLLRNKMNTIDLMSYEKVRSVLSIDDMAEWFYLNDSFKIDNCTLSNTCLEFYWDNYHGNEHSEVKNSVIPLSISEEIANSAKAKLTGIRPGEDSLYSFISIDNTLFLFLHEGIMTKLLDPSYKAEFVKNYLKQCYAMAPVSDVSMLPVYKLYLSHIAN